MACNTTQTMEFQVLENETLRKVDVVPYPDEGKGP
jgi:hypothetical protein